MILPEPKANPFLFGHERAERLLDRAARDGRLHHAWLLCGPIGVGKATLAYRFARALLAGFPRPLLELPSDMAIFRQVSAGTHPDLLELRCRRDGKSDILVEEARDALEIFTRTAAGAGWRVVIVDGAENLTASAANALLKMLEEPPERAVFLLTSAAPRRLMPTIRSRCAHLALRPLDRDDMERVFTHLAEPADEAAWRRALETAHGSPGRVLRACRSPVGPSAARPTLAGEDLATEILERIHHAVRRSLEEAIAAAPQQGARRDMIHRQCERWHLAVRLADQAARFNLDRNQLAIALERGAFE